MNSDNVNKLIRPKIRMFKMFRPAYQICGYSGLVLSFILAMALVIKLNLSIWLLMVIAATGVLTFLSLAMLTKIITGRERLIYYHHEIAILFVVAILLKLLHQPVLPYLDITILGIGTFLFCGRIGCFMAGCCHGKPHRWGVCYGKAHADAGFTPYLVGVPLFPVQLLESLIVLLIVIVGTVFVLSSAYRPGEALTWYIIAYGAARFSLEFLRGDPDRPYFAGFSEAQWTSVILMSLVVLGEFSHSLLTNPWHAGAVLLIVSVMIVLFIKRKFNKAGTYNILLARHIQEVAGAVDAAVACKCTQPDISISNTSLGYRISAGGIEAPAGLIYHYAFSKEDGTISKQAAHALSELILRIKHPGNQGEVVKGNEGVFHLLVHA